MESSKEFTTEIAKYVHYSHLLRLIELAVIDPRTEADGIGYEKAVERIIDLSVRSHNDFAYCESLRKKIEVNRQQWEHQVLVRADLERKVKSLTNEITRLNALVENIKYGKGWYEDTPGGQRFHCWVNEDEEMRYAEKEIARLHQWVNDLQSKLYVNCVYCGFRYGREDAMDATMADVLKAHVEQCPQHPMSALKAELAKEKEDHATCRDTLVRTVNGACTLQVENDELKLKVKAMSPIYLTPDFYRVIQDTETGKFFPKGESLKFVHCASNAACFREVGDAANVIKNTLGGDFQRFAIKQLNFAVL